MRVSFSRAPGADEGFTPQAAARTAMEIVRDAALSLIAQANVDRHGAVRLLLR